MTRQDPGGLPAGEEGYRLALLSRIRRGLASPEVRILLVSVTIHLLLQLALNWMMPFPNYSELGMGDATAYYPISAEPFPSQPAFSPNKYRRILLPLLVRTLFSWDRHFGFLIVNVVAVSLASVFFYRIARRHTAHPVELTLLFSAVPYLFTSAHLGYAEPLMVAGLLAGYDAWDQRRTGQSVVWNAVAVLAKEIAVFPVLALIAVTCLQRRWREALILGLAFVPAAAYYLALGWHWGDPLWLLGGDVERLNIGFTPLAIVDLIVNGGAPEFVPPWFLVLNQMGNVALLGLLSLAIYALRKRKDLCLYLVITSVPLLFLGWAVVFLNWHVGRQALLSSLSVLAADRLLPRWKRWLWPVVLLMLFWSLFQSLFWAKFFWIHKF